MDALYERFGGLDAVAEIVFAFYDRVQRSQRLAPYFAGIDMPRLIQHQTKLLASVIGGPEEAYSEAHLHRLHAHLSISDDDFDEMISLLGETLKGFSLEAGDRKLILAEYRARRASIVGAPEAETAS